MLNAISVMNATKSTISSLKEFNDNTGDLFRGARIVWKVLTTPALLMDFIQSVSFTACVVVVCVGVIAYAIGYKKANNWVTGSIAAYIIIKMISVAI